MCYLWVVFNFFYFFFSILITLLNFRSYKAKNGDFLSFSKKKFTVNQNWKKTHNFFYFVNCQIYHIIVLHHTVVKGGENLFFGNYSQGGDSLFVLQGDGGTLRRGGAILKNFYFFAKMAPKIVIFKKKMPATANILTYFNNV